MNGWILVVDDDPDVREALATVLEAYGFDVGAASGGLDALDLLLERGRPSLAVLDLRMPGMTGEELHEALDELYFSDPIPVIVMSGEPRAEQSARRRHAHECLKKPVPLPELLSAVDRCLEDAHAPGA